MKTILYYTDLLPLLSKGEKALDKLERSLKFFFDNKEKVRLIWHPYTRMHEFFELNKFGYTEKYDKIVEDYKNQGWGEFDQEKDPRKIADGCDAYYGDYSNIVYYMKEAGKPSMIQDINL